MTQTITIELDDDTAAVFEQLASRTNRDERTLIADAVRLHAQLAFQHDGAAGLTDEDIASIREGLEAMERGEVVSQDVVMTAAGRIINGDAG